MRISLVEGQLYADVNANRTLVRGGWLKSRRAVGAGHTVAAPISFRWPVSQVAAQGDRQRVGLEPAVQTYSEAQ